MDLRLAAKAEVERRTRSSLEPHRAAIGELRRKHWTYGQIAEWLKSHGIKITLSSVHRFCTARKSSVSIGFETRPEIKAQAAQQPKRHRFNLDI